MWFPIVFVTSDVLRGCHEWPHSLQFGVRGKEFCIVSNLLFIYLLQINANKLSDGHNNDKKGHKDDL